MTTSDLAIWVYGNDAPADRAAVKMVPYHLRRDGYVIVGRMATWVPTGGGRAFAHRLVSEPEQEPTGGLATEPKRTGLPHASKHEGAADRDEGDGHVEGAHGAARRQAAGDGAGERGHGHRGHGAGHPRGEHGGGATGGAGGPLHGPPASGAPGLRAGTGARGHPGGHGGPRVAEFGPPVPEHVQLPQQRAHCRASNGR